MDDTSLDPGIPGERPWEDEVSVQTWCAVGQLGAEGVDEGTIRTRVIEAARIALSKITTPDLERWHDLVAEPVDLAIEARVFDVGAIERAETLLEAVWYRRIADRAGLDRDDPRDAEAFMVVVQHTLGD
jgi:hypothetical protein